MSRKRAIDYIEEELKSISTRIRPFIEWGILLKNLESSLMRCAVMRKNWFF